MCYFRSLLAALCFTIFGIGGFLIGSIIFPICLILFSKSKGRHICAQIVHYSWIFFVQIMRFCRLIDVHVINPQRLHNLTGHIVIANHPSLIDIVLLIALIPNAITLVKGTLAHNFFMKHIIRRIYLVNDLKTDVFLKKAADLLQHGFNIIIFPEGTRTNFHQTEHKFHRGFMQLALRTGCPILPIKIDLTPKFLGKNQKWYQVGATTLQYTLTVNLPISISNDKSWTLHKQAKEYTNQINHIFFN